MPVSLFAPSFDQAALACPDAAGLVWRRPGWAPRPGPVWGRYPMLSLPAEQPNLARAWWQQYRHHARPPGRHARAAVVHRIRGLLAAWGGLDDATFTRQVQHVRVQLLGQGLQGPALGAALAVASEAVRRCAGLAVRDTQLHAAQAMLANAVIELATGEGKTLVAVLTAAVAALAGVPVHVLSSNDYLAARDAETWAPVYRMLGLSVAAIQPQDDAACRRRTYACDVAYASARELAFDHLRDRLAMQGAAQRGGLASDASAPVMRGLCMAVLDEADSVLVDEATMPMILSAPLPDDQVQRHRVALFLARQLTRGDQAIEQAPGQWRLSEAACDWLAARAAHLGPDWRLQRLREELVTTALAALHSFERDVHYVVHEGEIQIVDSHTGRRAQGRSWSRGIHQLLAIKEGLTPTPPTQTLQQLSYQQLFPRYLRLCGQSGTVWEARRELMAVYGLPVVRVASHLPSQRVDRGTRVCRSDAALMAAVAARVCALQASGLPVLVGTRSVAESHAVSQALTACGVRHVVLNASQDADEAAIVSAAGGPGVVTVATQMAGRGTDIPVDDALARQGGLQVVSIGLHAARRTERQLAGRAGRKGQQGAHERWLSLADPAVGVAPGLRGPLLGLARVMPTLLNGWLAWRQRRESRRGQALRWRMLLAERRQAAQLAWATYHPWDR